jgi:hypothetical protein
MSRQKLKGKKRLQKVQKLEKLKICEVYYLDCSSGTFSSAHFNEFSFLITHMDFVEEKRIRVIFAHFLNLECICSKTTTFSDISQKVKSCYRYCFANSYGIILSLNLFKIPQKV